MSNTEVLTTFVSEGTGLSGEGAKGGLSGEGVKRFIRLIFSKERERFIRRRN